jgi:TonB family protein
VTYLGPSLRRTRRRTRPWARAAVAVVLSLLANALLLREVRVGLAPQRAVEVRRDVALAPLSASEWDANRRAPGVRPARPEGANPLAVALEPPPPPRTMKGQVVDVAPSKDSRAPKDSRFLSERDNTVEKETRSRHAKAGYANTAPVPTDPKASPPPDAERAVAAGEAGRAGGAASRQSKPKGGERLGSTKVVAPGERAERLALAPSRDGELRLREPHVGVERQAEPGAEALGTPTGGAAGERTAGAPGKPGPRASLSLHPSAATYDRLAGGPAPDRLDAVEEGEGTYLNTREFKYASYFNRIKQAVANQWDPQSALQSRDPTGDRFAYKDRLTLVAVRLDDSGALKDVTVEKSSGVDFLDRVAVDAFRKAQPFVNPPRGLADGHGEILFSFGFYIELGTGLHIFRGATPTR